MLDFYLMIAKQPEGPPDWGQYGPKYERRAFEKEADLIAALGKIVSGENSSEVLKLYRIDPSTNTLEELEPFLDTFQLLLRPKGEAR